MNHFITQLQKYSNVHYFVL